MHSGKVEPMELLERIERDAPRAGELFPGFEERYVEVGEGSIFCRIAGSGPPLLLLHGYPQTSAMWHLTAPKFAERYKVVCPDLRGYGRSFKPATDDQHLPYSKREMAKDMVRVMSELGCDRFLIGSHDRGARVAHRLALDSPECVKALVVIDIAPTREMYRDGGSEFAQVYWHWYWLTQPAPFPETMIGYDPDNFLLTRCGYGSSNNLSLFYWEALREYLESFRDPEAIHASCEDYRAAWTIDIAHDNEDERNRENAKVKPPLLALWGAHGAIEKFFNCLELWRERVEDVRGESLPGGHYLAEECPELLLEKMERFFSKHV